jgi:HEAT repeat protein
LLTFLIQSLSSPLAPVQTASALTLSNLNHLDALVSQKQREALAGFLRDRANSPEARRIMVQVLSKMGGFDALISDLAEKDPDIRLAALSAMGSGGAGAPLQMDLIDVCLQDPDPEVRLKTLDLLLARPGPETDGRLAQLALDDASVEVRALALSAVGSRGGDTAETVSRQALEDPSPLVVFVASDEIRKTGSENAAETLGQLLDRDDPTIRFVGVIMLGTMEAAAAHTILQDAARIHPDPKTRDMAARVLESDSMDMDTIRKHLGVDEVLSRRQKSQ